MIVEQMARLAAGLIAKKGSGTDAGAMTHLFGQTLTLQTRGRGRKMNG